MKIIVLVPVYKPLNGLNKFERETIINHFEKSQGLVDICFFGPSSLKQDYIDCFHYTSYYSFDKKYFKNIFGYNRLLKSLSFFRKFENYDFMLIAQTDAWILGSLNDLLKFTKYDYCGAISYSNELPYGYNGGLSFRNIASSIKALKSFKNLENSKEIWNRHFTQVNNTKPLKIFSFFLDFLIRKKIHHRLNFFTKCNEDIFWSVLVPKAVPEFKVITSRDAVEFSWEYNCIELDKNNSLPFGCHGWWNYNYDFWKKYISIENK